VFTIRFSAAEAALKKQFSDGLLDAVAQVVGGCTAEGPSTLDVANSYGSTAAALLKPLEVGHPCCVVSVTYDRTHFHGDNTGSSPVRDANETEGIVVDESWFERLY
jgi:hypothetical protein